MRAADRFSSLVLFATCLVLVNCGYIWPEITFKYSPYNLQRIILGAGCSAILALSLFQRRERNNAFAALSQYFVPTPFSAALLLVAFTLTAISSLSVFGLYQLAFLCAVVQCAALLSSTRSPLIALSVVAAITIYSVQSLLELSAYSLQGIDPGANGITYGFSNKRFLSHLHTTAIPLIIASGLFFDKKSPLRYLLLVLGSLTICHLILAGSRGSSVAIISATIIGSVIFRARMLPFLVALLASTALASAIAILLASGWSGTEQINLSMARGGTSGRLELWRDAIIKIIANPITGYGAGNYSLATSPTHHLSTPHNSILLIAFEHGVPAALSTIALASTFVCIVFKKLLRKDTSILKLAAGVSLLAALIHSLVSGIQLTPPGQLGLVAILAILMSKELPNPAANETASRRQRHAFSISLIIVFFILSIQLIMAVHEMFSPACDMSQSGKPRIWNYIDSPCV